MRPADDNLCFDAVLVAAQVFRAKQLYSHGHCNNIIIIMLVFIVVVAVLFLYYNH